ncbi:MAG: hypothetical protein AAF539_08535, partial [Planctomycetota bacterium]
MSTAIGGAGSDWHKANDASSIGLRNFAQSSFARLHGVAKNIAVIAMLQMLLPITLGMFFLALVRRLLVREPALPSQSCEEVMTGKTVLISGGKMTKSLQLARSMKRAGARVLLCETSDYAITAHQFSNCVDAFWITPDPDDPGYAKSLRDIVVFESVDMYIPVCSPVASISDSHARRELDSLCDVVHPSPETIDMLDDKFQLARAAQAIGLGACESFRISDPSQVTDFDFAAYRRPFILKSIVYDSVRRLDLTRLPRQTAAETAAFVQRLPISNSKPWVLQEFIPGKEFCTHSTVRDGQLKLHVCCESSASQVNYESVDEPEIEAWVHRFVSHYRLTGQISFDFIRADDDGRLYVIECNPRTHSAITAFHDHPDVAHAYVASQKQQVGHEPTDPTNPRSNDDVIRPLVDSKPTYWLAHEMWRIWRSLLSFEGSLSSRWNDIASRVQTVVHGKDAVFD